MWQLWRGVMTILTSSWRNILSCRKTEVKTGHVKGQFEVKEERQQRRIEKEVENKIRSS